MIISIYNQLKMIKLTNLICEIIEKIFNLSISIKHNKNNMLT